MKAKRMYKIVSASIALADQWIDEDFNHEIPDLVAKVEEGWMPFPEEFEEIEQKLGFKLGEEEDFEVLIYSILDRLKERR